MNQLRIAMIGGANDSLIGPTHVASSQWFDKAKLVAGFFSRDPAKSLKSGEAYGVDPTRCYSTLESFFRKESPKTLDAVIIATPNSTHIPYATEMVQHGLHVMYEKPLGNELEGAYKLADLIEQKNVVFGLAHHNTGYAAIRAMRNMIQSEELGRLRLMRSTYIQGWLSASQESANTPQAAWRLDPMLSGPSCCLADIGSHVLNLMGFVSDLGIESYDSILQNFVADRQVDDFCNLFLHYEQDVIGTLTASQISTGYKNEIELHCDCEEGSLSWYRARPQELVVRSKTETQTKTFDLTKPNRHQQQLMRLSPKLDELPNVIAFANLYDSFFEKISGKENTEVITIDSGIETLNVILDSAASFRA